MHTCHKFVFYSVLILRTLITVRVYFGLSVLSNFYMLAYLTNTMLTKIIIVNEYVSQIYHVNVLIG